MENTFSTNFDELFNDDITKTPKMKKDDFIFKAKEVFKKIEKEYAGCWTSRRVTDEEYEQADCDNCKGQCVFNINDREVDCFPDKAEGDCFIRQFDNELFTEEMENIIFHDVKLDFFELLCCDIENE